MLVAIVKNTRASASHLASAQRWARAAEQAARELRIAEQTPGPLGAEKEEAARSRLAEATRLRDRAMARHEAARARTALPGEG